MYNWSSIAPNVYVCIQGDATLQIAKVNDRWNWSFALDDVFKEGQADSMEQAKSFLSRQFRIFRGSTWS